MSDGLDTFFSPALQPYFIPGLIVLCCLGLAVAIAFWRREIGWPRALLAGAARLAWVAPLVAALFPLATTRELPRTIALKPVQILVDDSQSMQVDKGGKTAAGRLKDPSKAKAPSSNIQKSELLPEVEDVLRETSGLCQKFGCATKVVRLSELDRSTEQGLTPLNASLEAWFLRVGSDPWMILTDGADSQPELPWTNKIEGAGVSLAEGSQKKAGANSSNSSTSAPASRGGQSGKFGEAGLTRGLIFGFGVQDENNIWIARAEAAAFSFDGKPLPVSVLLKRTAALGPAGSHEKDLRIQVQAIVGGQAVATENIDFPAGATEASGDLVVPPLGRGQHLLMIRAIPTAGENTIWDNTVRRVVEVLPNTVGVLHLLGSPSWDGRFLRRYLKSEPKYDLISFFILRDPWDNQQVNERELSLIPFPVERLFKEELQNFRVVIIQNFTLFQFLLPEYQNNLVKFVQDGGGLLFMGGPRALQSADIIGSPLKAILPFDSDESMGAGGGSLRNFGGLIPPNMMGQNELDGDEAVGGGGAGGTRPVPTQGPAYDPGLKFRVQLAMPESQRRALANVYDDWEALGSTLAGLGDLSGMHHMERVKFRERDSTQLLTAKAVGTAQEMPLAVASYPGKGRALWLFSDAFWRLAMAPDTVAARQVYNQFMGAAMTWLTRSDLRKPMIVRGFWLTQGPGAGRLGTAGSGRWRARLFGPAARYLGEHAGEGVGAGKGTRKTSEKTKLGNGAGEVDGAGDTGKGGNKGVADTDLAGQWRVQICGANEDFSRISLEKIGADEWELSGPLAATLAPGDECAFNIVGQHPAFGSVQASMTGILPGVFRDDELNPSAFKLQELSAVTGAKLIGGDGKNQQNMSTNRSEVLEEWLAQITGSAGVALPKRTLTSQDHFWILGRWWFYLLLLALPLEVVVRRWHVLGFKRG